MRYPNQVNAYELDDGGYRHVTAKLPDGKIRIARPLGFGSPGSRLKSAWLVFTGKADALIWPGQEN